MMENTSGDTLKKTISAVLCLVVALSGALIVLYAWQLPPFTSVIQSTENAVIRGQVTVISPQLSGYVTSVPVQDFQNVKQGDLLVQIDDRIYLQKIEQAKAHLAMQNAALSNRTQDRRSAEASIAQSNAGLQNAIAQEVKAQSDYQRVEKLVKDGTLPTRELDQVRAARAQANAAVIQGRAAIEIAKQNLATVEVNSTSLEAEVANAEATLQLATIDLNNTKILSPRDGQLGQVSVRQGAYVNAGTQLMSLVPRELWVIANMKETQMANIRIGQPATFQVDALNHVKLKGQVQEISPATGSEFSVLPADNATGNYVKISQRIPVRIQIAPDQEMVDRLRPGMSVVVRIDTK